MEVKPKGFGDGRVLKGRSVEKPPEPTKFRRNKNDFTVTSRGETYVKGSKSLTDYITLYTCETVAQADLFYKVFCVQIHFGKHRDKDAVKLPYLQVNHKISKVHLLIDKNDFKHYQKALQYASKVALMYTYNDVVLEKLFDIYKHFINTYDMHIMEKKVFNLLDIDKIDRAMLYYSQPDKLKVVNR